VETVECSSRLTETESREAAKGRLLVEIRLYPVKSPAGVAVEQARVEPWSLRSDRRWQLLVGWERSDDA
jgi:hypothetical protein